MSARVDWEAAFTAWVGGGLTYSDIAREYGVAKRTVERVAAREGWQERRAEIERKARAKAEKMLVRDLAERRADTLRIIDAARVAFAGDLKDRRVRLTGSDFVGLMKLEQLLEGAATERTDIDPQQVQQVLAIVLRLVPTDKLDEFDRAVAGVLEAGPGAEADAA